MTSALNVDRQHEKGENRQVLAVGREVETLSFYNHNP
jgi:hypothetical protein